MQFLATLLLAGLSGNLVGAERLPSSAFGVPGVEGEFDYVVVGGGTAGLTIASRLSEHASVAVIEAGGFYETDNGNFSVVPFNSLLMGVLGSAPDYPRQPLVDWGLSTVPQTAYNGTRLHYAQGKTLGGSSALNTMGYHRGSKGSYQRWADLVDDQSYTFENLLPFFQKSCNFTPPDLVRRHSPNAVPAYDPASFSATGGPLHVSYVKWVDPTVVAMSGALEQIGLSISLTGFNSGILSGYRGYGTSTIDPTDATRSSSYSSFLKQALPRTEIIVYAHTQAMKVNFNSDKKAKSVLISTQGLEYTIFAKKEVIISAGVFHSPQLLMVSGIGPAAVLESHNITVLSHLPGVGRNLWDPVFFITTTPVNTSSGSALLFGSNSSAVLEEYLEDGSGPWGAAGGHFSFEKIPARLRTNFTNQTEHTLSWFPSDWPEVEYGVAPSPGENGETLGAFGATIVAPSSRGSVSIISSSMADQPLIDLNRLSSPADLEILVAAFKRQREFWNTPAAQAIKTGPETSPGEAIQTDAQIADFIKGNLFGIYHASSTCSMGRKNDTKAVVDHKARVYGVEGLRVVDNSVTPFAVPGHPQATVYMLAEKIADAILRDLRE